MIRNDECNIHLGYVDINAGACWYQIVTILPSLLGLFIGRHEEEDM